MVSPPSWLALGHWGEGVDGESQGTLLGYIPENVGDCGRVGCSTKEAWKRLAGSGMSDHTVSLSLC